jgi:ferredoxin
MLVDVIQQRDAQELYEEAVRACPNVAKLET